jgi:hypothetical protein
MEFISFHELSILVEASRKKPMASVLNPANIGRATGAAYALSKYKALSPQRTSLLGRKKGVMERLSSGPSLTDMSKQIKKENRSIERKNIFKRWAGKEQTPTLDEGPELVKRGVESYGTRLMGKKKNWDKTKKHIVRGGALGAMSTQPIYNVVGRW